MKKLTLYCLGLLAVFNLQSCTQDFLEVELLTELNNENFYTTTDDAYAALVGCYDGLQRASGGVAGLSYPIASMVLSDNFFGGAGNADGYEFQAVDEFDISRSPVDQNLFEPLWEAYYRAIYRCNMLINNMDQIEWEEEDPELRMQYESEARFIRAYLYFQMVKMWGNIPLLTEPSTENLPQAEPDEVYSLIAEDLSFGAGNLPAETYNSIEAGRVTKWAAKAMLARVYLYYTGYYNQSDLVGMVSREEALQHVEDVIQSSGHDLVPEFANLWPASLENFAGEDNEEIVFSVKHTYTSDYNGNTDGNHWMIMLGMREFTHYPYANGWGITVNPKIYKAYNSADSRQKASIIAVEEEEIPFDKIDSQREYTGYYTKKYTPLSDEDGQSVVIGAGGEDFQIGQFQDFYVIRYSDVLLMAAELGSANAQDYFDQVKERAYGDDFSSVSVTQARIEEERRLEFALEGIRYWDLLRRGVDEAAQVIAEETILLNGGNEVTKTISASNIQSTEGLQQIPNNQITLSDGVLIQNPGW